MVELSGAFSGKQVHEVHVGGSATPGCSAATLGSTPVSPSRLTLWPIKYLFSARKAVQSFRDGAIDFRLSRSPPT
jgi:hypothetical protein